MSNQSISYTFLSVYKRCKKRAYLQYVKRMVPSDQVNHRPFIVGIVADWLFKKWAQGGFVEGWMEKKAEEMYYWFVARRNIVYRNPQDKDGLIRKLISSVRHLEGAALAECLPDRQMELQKKVKFSKEGFDFFGKLDIWFPDENTIWDLKITKSTRYLDNFQLFFFAWLLGHEGLQVNDLAFFSPLMRPYVRPVEYDITGRQDFELELGKLLELIRAEQWEMNASDCWGCPVARFCEEPVGSCEFKKCDDGGFEIDIGGQGE